MTATTKGRAFLIQGDARRLALADKSVHCCVTSPPYFALRDYQTAGQIGLEASASAYLATMVGVFREVHRVLRDDATLWLNVGDNYGAGKQMTGMPWRLALALQADGWVLRQDIIWHKPNPMPESASDRCTKAHEYLFLLAKRERYYYDAEAIKTPVAAKTLTVNTTPRKGTGVESAGEKVNAWMEANGGRYHPATANKRSVWSVATFSCRDAHFATFPPRLVEPCVLAGTSAKGVCPACGAPWMRIVDKVRTPTRPGAATKVKVPSGWDTGRGGHGSFHREGRGKPEYRDILEVGNRDPQRHVTQTVTSGWVPGCKCGVADTVPATVLDCFNGAGTTGLVAVHHGRNYVGNELNRDYIEISRRRIAAGYRPPKAKRPKAQKPVRGEMTLF